MNRIIAFGCSYTYGHGLSDCIDTNGVGPGRCPSKLGFPDILATHLARKLINLSLPGIGDKHIMHAANNFIFKQSDICLIQWSHGNRHCMIKQQGLIDLGVWHDTKPARAYYKFLHDQWDADIMRNVYINYINLKLQSAGVKTYNILPIDTHQNQLTINKEITMSDKNIHKFKVDLGLDNSHPGQQTHKLFADYLINKYF
jgi:hypothetical protein|tara:strand:+ start:1440 stop:2039 length:600 start_codon:yes stop_codon:yes gene_type:complete